MNQYSLMPEVSVIGRINNLLCTNVLRVNYVLPRSIQCSDAQLKVIVAKPAHEHFETLRVKVLALSPYHLNVSDSQFARHVIENQHGWSIDYTLRGKAQICEFVDRLPVRLPYMSTVHLVNNNGPLSIREFLRHLDCGDSPYQSFKVMRSVPEDFRRDATKLSQAA